MTEAELAIADAIKERLGIASRSEVFRHLVLYQGLCGGDMPLTTKILALPEHDRDRLTEEILRRAREDDPAKPQSFALWVKETLGKADPDTLNRGADQLLRDLLG